MQNGLDRRAVLRRVKPARLHGAGETIEMVLEAKEPAAEHMHDVVDRVRPGEPPVSDGMLASAIGT